MIDYHCHLLPRLDDGSSDLAESVAMAEQLLAAGFTRVYCTPHCITSVYESSNVQVRTAVENLQLVLAEAGIPLQLDVGMEYYLDDHFFERLRDPLTLGSTGLLLFEIPGRGNFDLLREAVVQIMKRGLIPLLAHPERYPFMVIEAQKNNFIKRLWRGQSVRNSANDEIFHPIIAEIVQLGCLLQGDIGSFNGLYGSAAQRAANLFLAQGCYYCFGSDGHRSEQLQRVMGGLNAVCLAKECYQKRQCAEFKT